MVITDASPRTLGEDTNANAIAGYKWCITHHGTVQQLRNNPENEIIKKVEEIVYGDNINIYT